LENQDIYLWIKRWTRQGNLSVVGISNVLEPEYSREIYGSFWRVLMDATDIGHIKSLSFRGPRFETRYPETKHKQNLGIEALSTKTHVVDVINICKMNLRKK
jgi:hypothetical protein